MGEFWAKMFKNHREMKVAMKAQAESGSSMTYAQLRERLVAHSKAGGGSRSMLLAVQDLTNGGPKPIPHGPWSDPLTGDQLKLANIRAGRLEAVKPSEALLRPGETAYATVRAKLYAQQTVGYRAAGRGVSIKVMKGLTFRSGGGRAAQQKQIVEIAAGELVVTDQRIIFAGDRKSFEIPFAKLINYHQLADGFTISSGATTHHLVCGRGPTTEIFGAVLHRLLHA